MGQNNIMTITENEYDRVVAVNKGSNLEISVYSKRGLNSLRISLGEDIRKMIAKDNAGALIGAFENQEANNVDGFMVSKSRQQIEIHHGGGKTRLRLTSEEWDNFKRIMNA